MRDILSFVYIPLDWLLAIVQWDAPPFVDILYLIAVAVLAFVLVKFMVQQAWGLVKRDTLADRADIDAFVTSGGGAGDPDEAERMLISSSASLKKSKQWKELAALYASANHFKEAAKYFKKGGEYRQSGEMLSKQGEKVKAAKMMAKAGDFQAAGGLYMEQQKYAQATKIYIKGGHSAHAAEASWRGGKAQEAVDLYKEYFASPRDPQPVQTQAAKRCYDMLRSPDAESKISDEDKRALFPKIAHAFEQEKHYELSAQLYQMGGDLVRAGEVYVLAGKLEQAAKCLETAGKHKESARIGGQFYAQSGRWKEAGMAFAGAEEYLSAGECFEKAKEPVRAGEYFEKAKAAWPAGRCYARGGRFEKAVQMLQLVPDDVEYFDVSRALLGRCFYEVHDYGHCAATLENHLMGKRVEKSNMDYFYMLALAQEQLGNLEDSKNILLKIGAVDRKFRDLDQRVSNIDSRISMLGSKAGATPIPSAEGKSDSEVMGLVQNTLGERYEFERELGRGGMGVVYLAKDKQLDRKVALKFLGALVDNSDEYRQRFVREARTAAKINHPNIVAIYDISASEGKAYIAMEFIEGPSLFQLIQKKATLPIREALNYMEQACSALDAVHQSGIVHRDIKPDNLVIARGGLVKLMDFGLAKAEDNRITKANVVMGTPCYMAPEQAMGKDVDGRADLYAMGLVLYEMLTGKVLFLDGDVLTRQVKEDPPKLSSLVDGVSPEVDAFAFKCLAKDPDERFQTGKEMVEAIRGLPKPGKVAETPEGTEKSA